MCTEDCAVQDIVSKCFGTAWCCRRSATTAAPATTATTATSTVPDPCAAGPCQHGGVCVSQVLLGGTYTCQCVGGYTGANCQFPPPVDFPCESSPCLNGAACTNLPGHTYRCTCAPGWSGPTCSVNRNECATGTHNCHAQAACQDTPGSFTCSCATGWSGNGVLCSDLDEVRRRRGRRRKVKKES